MTTRILITSLATLVALNTARAQGTAFTYQGRLNDGTNAANGSYDLQFYLRDAATAGNPVGPTNTLSPVAVSNGFVTVTLDFGAGIFTGADRWLEIAVRTNGAGSFIALTTRQPVRPSPYAIHAAEAMDLLNGTVSNPTFIGTTTNAPLDLFANNQRGLRLESPSGGVPNLIIGGTGSSIDPSAVGSTIAGGGVPGFPNSIAVSSSFIGAGNANSITGPPGYNNNFIGAGYGNSIASVASFIGAGNNNLIQSNAWYSFIGAGSNNIVQTNARLAVIGGGEGNLALLPHATIGGGYFNTASGDYNTASGDSGTVAGGWQNSALGNNAAVAGGRYNSSLGDDSTVAGGAFNASLGLQSAIGGGIGNTNSSTRAFIGAGYYNTIEPGANASVIGGGTQNTIAVGAIQSTISGGYINVIAAGAQVAVIAGGSQNQIVSNAIAASIGGGSQNWIDSNADYAAIGGGRYNTNSSFGGAISGGTLNSINTNADFASIGGGTLNTNAGFAAVIAGGSQNRTEPSADYASIGGGRFNTNAGFAAAIAGGSQNWIDSNGDYSSIGCGQGNANGGLWAVIGGGHLNTITATNNGSIIAGGRLNTITPGAFPGDATIGGGFANTNSGNTATIGGGARNIASAPGATVSGGNQNQAGGTNAVIGGGGANLISGSYATIPGGLLNAATNFAFAAGRQAKANHQGAFVWGDSTSSDIASTNANSVTLRASGGYRLFSDSGATAGVFLAPSGTSWSSISDRDAKKNFAPVDAETVLKKLAAMPVQHWNYKWESDEATPHIGPMAQEFKGAFYPGRDDKSITTQEFDGVELAAIQGLNRKLDQKETEIAELKARLEALEKIIARQKFN